ncbi:TrlF family AAA-like ATPase [Sedimenticola selenatireducens]|uniref:TrlF family AAA-like ATPase n=1 Tax=Sedimenticola selenatireducens TaxID=191960 RepID=UPI000491905A|nr:AAA family ATPase [Sedimenticola selenatireducens]
MTNSVQPDWLWPGSRWWKFDFHTHTPASTDTPWAKQNLALSPEDWLLKYMAAGVDCVAVTDHNSGAWIDGLKVAYDQMKQQAENGTPPGGFCEMTLFPGVEISVNGGFHLLAIFDPSATTSDIDSLLGKVDYQGTKGDSDGVTRASAIQVVQAVLDAGGIPIPAHADDGGKGLLRVNAGTRECALDANTVRQVMDMEHLLAVEWLDNTVPTPACVEKQTERLARILGSDCHSFQGNAVPGSRFTWIKMAIPTLEGLRLALLDGNGISVRRSEEGAFEPFQTPANFITSIEVESARFMGNGTAEHIAFSPYYNALIGGRGTGKSTVVHAFRLAYRRDEELRRLGDKSEPYRRFSSFSETVKGHDGNGALRESTEIRLQLMRDGVLNQLRWRQNGAGIVVEEQGEDGVWRASSSQTVSGERFPVRIFSQGQIAAMAGESRQALLDVIDEAAEVGDLHRNFEEVKRSYFSQRARLRELDGRLDGRSELERKLADLNRKIEALSQSHHAEVLKAHQQGLKQQREVNTTIEQLQATPDRIESLAQDLLLDDWPDGTFNAEQDADALAWRAEAEGALREAREALAMAAQALTAKVQALNEDRRLADWRQRAGKAQAEYQALQAALAEQGVMDPQAFGRLVQERQQLEGQLKLLDRIQQDREQLEAENAIQWVRVLDARISITTRRSEFVSTTLEANAFVRMDVIGFGFDARSIERNLRDLLDVQDDRFESDILRFDAGEPAGGLALDLASAVERADVVEDVKRRLIELDVAGGHFRNYLQRKLDKPEFADHIRCWFPDDDLRIEYSRSGDGRDWSAITQGSQGQRSAALLAFLLAFGDEPLILDQPEDDLDNHLIYELIVRQIRENKRRRQLIIVTHNPNVVVNGDAEMVHAFDFRGGQCRVIEQGALQEKAVREEVCRVMEGGREAFSRRWARLGREV